MPNIFFSYLMIVYFFMRPITSETMCITFPFGVYSTYSNSTYERVTNQWEYLILCNCKTYFTEGVGY